jgi:hypothetical protein
MTDAIPLRPAASPAALRESCLFLAHELNQSGVPLVEIGRAMLACGASLCLHPADPAAARAALEVGEFSVRGAMRVLEERCNGN